MIITAGDVVEFTGITAEYMDQLQVSVNKEQHIFKKCLRSEYSIEDFVPHTENDVDQMSPSFPIT